MVREGSLSTNQVKEGHSPPGTRPSVVLMLPTRVRISQI
jgi:hypothetical protein